VDGNALQTKYRRADKKIPDASDSGLKNVDVGTEVSEIRQEVGFCRSDYRDVSFSPARKKSTREVGKYNQRSRRKKVLFIARGKVATVGGGGRQMALPFEHF